MSETHCSHGRKWYRCCDPEANVREQPAKQEPVQGRDETCAHGGDPDFCENKAWGDTDYVAVKPHPPAGEEVERARRRFNDECNNLGAFDPGKHEKIIRDVVAVLIAAERAHAARCLAQVGCTHPASICLEHSHKVVGEAKADAAREAVERMHAAKCRCYGCFLMGTETCEGHATPSGRIVCEAFVDPRCLAARAAGGGGKG
jgi:hypothetical protein